MTTQTQVQSQNIRARAEELLSAGRKRQVVATTKTGRLILNANLNVVLGVLAVLTIIGFVSIPVIIIATIAAIFFGVKLEVLLNDEAEDVSRLSNAQAAVDNENAETRLARDDESTLWNG